MTDERFDILAEISPDAPAAMKELYSNYDKRIYEWAIKLWDPELGGFYYIAALKTFVAQGLFLHVGLKICDTESSNNLLLGLGYRF